MQQIDFLLKFIFFVKRVIKKITLSGCISDYEKYVVNKFYSGMKDINYLKHYPKLINNLDKKSITCVDNIISKIKLVAEKKIFFNKHIFNFKEQKQIKNLIHNFYPNIKKINENCYKYKNYTLPLNHFEPSVFYYKHNIEELNKNKFKYKDIIDVGAYIGDSAIVLSPYTKGTVYSFEPTSEIYDLMQKTLKLNPECKNIVPVKKGLGAECETKIIHVLDSGSSINRVFTNQKHEKEIIELTTLDIFVKENNLNNIGLIKVDIEGFEQEFLKGAINTIKSQKPTLLLSIYHFADDFFNIKPIIEDLNLGYKFKIVKSVDGSIRGEIVLICEP
ncbi:FkbM family methyltransferase [bacterium]|nr:FkbM family methyltransferase [bacterium]